MNKNIAYLVGIILIAFGGYYLLSQQNPDPQTNSQTQNTSEEASSSDTALSNPMTFEGTLPCADCAGLDTTVTLNPDKTYTMSEVYQGKNDDEPFQTQGTWDFDRGTPTDENATVYALRNDNGEVSYYLATADSITMLDQDKNTIDAPFNTSLTLKK